jgi:glycosyltransferase involved in cell wall biosynthesis
VHVAAGVTHGSHGHHQWSSEEAAGPGERPAFAVVVACDRRSSFGWFTAATVADTPPDWQWVLAGPAVDVEAFAADLRRAAVRAERVRAVPAPERGAEGVAALNHAIRATEAPFFAVLAPGEALAPQFVARAIAELRAAPDAAIAVGDAAGLARTLQRMPFLGIPLAAVIRRSEWDALGGFRADEAAGYELADYLFRVSASGAAVVHLPQFGVYRRIEAAAGGAAPPPTPQPRPRVVKPLLPRPRPRGRPRLRILHTVERYAPREGAQEHLVRELSERLARRGHEVVVATGHQPDRDLAELGGVRIEPFRVSGSIATGVRGADADRYRAFLSGGDFDVAMHYGSQQWATDLALVGIAGVAERRVNVLAPCGWAALADDLAGCRPGFHDYFTRVVPAALRRFDALVHHARTLRDHRLAERLGLAGRAALIPTAAAEEEFEQPPRLDFRALHRVGTSHVVLCVGSFVRTKAQGRVLSALRALGRDDVTAVFAGGDGGTLEACRQLAAGLPHVRILEAASREELLAAFFAADLLVHGSEVDPLPRVLVEAMAAGLPFVSVDAGCARELPGGAVCAPRDLASEIRRLLDDPAARKATGDAGRAAWAERHAWGAVTDAWEDLYLRLVDARRRRALGAPGPDPVPPAVLGAISAAASRRPEARARASR